MAVSEQSRTGNAGNGFSAIPDDARPLAIENDTSLVLGMSCGVAERREQETIEAVIKRADQALYAAKAAGRSRVLRAA